MRPRIFIVLILAFLSFLLDQATKYFIKTHFLPYERVTVIPGFFNITYVTNTGTAFGFFSFLGPRTLLWIAVIALVVMVAVYVRHSLKSAEVAYGLSLIVGGALGNMFDRLRFGYVVDFLDVHYKDKFVWPTFNFADVVICIGVALMLFGLLKSSESQKIKVEEKHE